MDYNHHHFDGNPGFVASILLALVGQLIGAIDWDHAHIPVIVMQSLQCLAWICPVGILYLTYKKNKEK